MRWSMLVSIALGASLAACGTDPVAAPTLTPAESEPTPTDSAPPTVVPSETTSEPDGERSLFVASLETSNGTIPPPYGYVATPQVAVLADGRVRAAAGQQVAELQLSQEEFEAFVQQVSDADLGRFTDFEPSGDDLVTGAPTTTLRVDVGEPVEVRAYNLGEGWPAEVTGVTARLEELADAARTSGTTGAPERVRLYTTLPLAEPVGPEMAWPAGVPVPAGIDDVTTDAAAPVETEHEGAEAAAVIDAFGGEDFAMWTLTEPEGSYQVAWVPLLP